MRKAREECRVRWTTARWCSDEVKLGVVPEVGDEQSNASLTRCRVVRVDGTKRRGGDSEVGAVVAGEGAAGNAFLY